jgi:hypothetical protein
MTALQSLVNVRPRLATDPRAVGIIDEKTS